MTEKHIEDSSAPLIDHLIELRTRLIRSILAFVVAMMVCFAFAEPLFEFLAEPIKQAMLKRGNDPTLIFTGAHKVFFTYVSVAMSPITRRCRWLSISSSASRRRPTRAATGSTSSSSARSTSISG